jgi:hypothetical protein
MPENQKRALVDVHHTLERILEVQRSIDSRARNIVDRIKRLVEVHEVFEPGANETFGQLHGAWYNSVERELIAAGFHSLGPYHNTNGLPGRPPEKQSYCHFALTADGTINATWFLVIGKKPRPCVVLESTANDGVVLVTESGTTGAIPVPPNQRIQQFPAETAIEKLVAAHREQIARASAGLRRVSGIAELLAERLQHAEETAAYRRELGLALFEPMLRVMSGDRFEKNGKPVLDSILAHPEWWTSDERETSTPPPGLRINFRKSIDQLGARGRMTTFGLSAYGLPELQMTRLAANHSRAARLIMSAVAQRLVTSVNRSSSTKPIGQRVSGIDLTITQDDLRQGQTSSVMGPANDAGEMPPVTVHLEPESFGEKLGRLGEIFDLWLEGKRAANLLSVKAPPGTRANSDEWLRESCRRLGMVVPQPVPLSAFHETMRTASRRGVNDLTTFRARLDAGLPAGQFAMIKTGLPGTSVRREYVWVRVIEWPAGEFVGTLEVQPVDVQGVAKGQLLRVVDADVFDRAIVSTTDGVIETAPTDVVAMDFGVPLP